MSLYSTSRCLLLVVAALSVGCAGKEKLTGETPAPAPPPLPREVGAVATVNVDLGFVLIDARNFPVPTAGLALKSFPPGVRPDEGSETAVLAVGAERRGPFVVADVVKGAPSKGDRVFR